MRPLPLCLGLLAASLVAVAGSNTSEVTAAADLLNLTDLEISDLSSGQEQEAVVHVNTNTLLLEAGEDEDNDTMSRPQLSVTVDYEEQCEQETVRSCPPAAAYGHSGYCKGEAAEVCYNVPRVRPAQTSVTVTYPVAERKCENKPVKVPKMQCREVEVSS